MLYAACMAASREQSSFYSNILHAGSKSFWWVIVSYALAYMLQYYRTVADRRSSVSQYSPKFWLIVPTGPKSCRSWKSSFSMQDLTSIWELQWAIDTQSAWKKPMGWEQYKPFKLQWWTKQIILNRKDDHFPSVATLKSQYYAAW